MANFKSNGELLPEISGLMTSIIGSLPRTAHGLRLTRRGKRFSRNFKPTVLVWSLFVSALLLLSFASFALKFIFTGYEETGISSTLGVQIVNNSESSSLKFLDLEGAGNGTSDVAGNGESGTTLSFQGVEKVSESIVVDTPPKRKLRKRHFACNISFSDKVEHIIQPEEVRNFSRFFLEYVSEDKKPLEASSFESKFGGHQTMEEREVSFYAKNQTVHCGFVKAPPGFRSTGFDLEEKDRAYMNSCVVVVSSCIFGSSDFLRRPSSKKISDFSKENVCFVMFVDEQTLSKLSYDGSVPDENGHIGLWKIVVVRNLPYTDMRRTGKVPKLLSHRLFPSASYSIWIDSKMRLVTDPMLIIDYFLWRTRSDFAISNHYDRHCVWEEVLQNKRLDKYNHTAIDEQFNFYQSDGLTKFDPLDKNSPLPSFVPEGSFIIRAHTPMSNLFSCLWFNEVDRFTSRDQLSFAYTYLKLRRLNPDQPFYLSMFKDCERRALTKLFRHRELA